MRIPFSVFLLIFVSAAAVGHAEQTQPAPATAQTQPAPSPAQSATVPVVTASSLLQPALTRTQATLSSLHVDKWKKGSVRDEAGQNVEALLRDLQTNIPPLVQAADSAPGAVSRGIPLLKHLDAFYDVLLRVEEASRVSAPGDQIYALQQALLDVNKARMALDDQMTAAAANQEQQVVALQAQLRAQAEAPRPSPAATATAPCKPVTPVKKKRRTTTSDSSKTSSGKPSAGTPAQPQ